MCNYTEVATADDGDSVPPSLSEDQRSRFWELIRKNLEAARAIAGRITAPKNAEDIVNTAALRAIESSQLLENPSAFLDSEDDFRRWFLFIVRNHSISCVRVPRRGEHPIHSHWSDAPEPAVGGCQVADRDLDRVFARNDQGEYDAPAPTERHVKDDLDELHQILRCHVEDLSDAQREIIVETFFEGRKRAQVAARRGISVCTYDNHLQAAFRALRESMQGVIDIATGIDLPPWYDRVEELLERYAAAQRHRQAREKGKRSAAKGQRSNVEGERGISADERAQKSRAGAA